MNAWTMFEEKIDQCLSSVFCEWISSDPNPIFSELARTILLVCDWNNSVKINSGFGGSISVKNATLTL